MVFVSTFLLFCLFSSSWGCFCSISILFICCHFHSMNWNLSFRSTCHFILCPICYLSSSHLSSLPSSCLSYHNFCLLYFLYLNFHSWCFLFNSPSRLTIISSPLFNFCSAPTFWHRSSSAMPFFLPIYRLGFCTFSSSSRVIQVKTEN